MAALFASDGMTDRKSDCDWLKLSVQASRRLRVSLWAELLAAAGVSAAGDCDRLKLSVQVAQHASLHFPFIARVPPSYRAVPVRLAAARRDQCGRPSGRNFGKASGRVWVACVRQAASDCAGLVEDCRGRLSEAGRQEARLGGI